MPDPKKELQKNNTQADNTINTKITTDILENINTDVNKMLEDADIDMMFTKKKDVAKDASDKKKEKKKEKKGKAKATVVSAKKLTPKELKKQEIRRIRKFEADNNDYSKYGIGFDLEHVDMNFRDSREMKYLKFTLKQYLQFRKEVFKNNNLRERNYAREIGIEDGNITNNEVEYEEKQDRMAGLISISQGEQTELARLYARVVKCVDNYISENDAFIKTDRGRERLNQVKRVRELINNDNRRFFLSARRRELLTSTDAEDAMHIKSSLFPSYLNAVFASDRISDRNQAYRDKRRQQKKDKKLPSLFKRHNEWWKTATINNLNRLAMGYHITGGLIDRTLGAATMLASNALTLVGKAVKTPLKVLSLLGNLVVSPFTKKRWNMDYSLTKGWSNVDEGRKIFRDCAKGLVAIPTAMVEAVGKGFPYLFRKMRGTARADEKVFGATGKLTSGLRSRISKNLRGLGITKGWNKYGLADKEYVSENIEDLEEYSRTKKVRDNISFDEDDEFFEISDELVEEKAREKIENVKALVAENDAVEEAARQKIEEVKALVEQENAEVEKLAKNQEEKEEEKAEEKAEEKIEEKVETEAEKEEEEKVEKLDTDSKKQENLVTNKVIGDAISRQVPAEEKQYLDSNSPEVLELLEEERRIYNPADYPEETRKHYEALLTKNNFPVPKDMTELTRIRNKRLETKYFFKKDKNGRFYETYDSFWKADENPVFKEAYTWLAGYFRANQDNYKEPEPIRYNPKAVAPLIGEHTPYEHQGDSLYCWACTMNGLMNEYAGHKISDLNMVKNTPLNIPSFEESGFTDRAMYNQGVQLANDMHDGYDTGNPIIFGDYITEKLPGTAVATVNIGISRKNRALSKRRFLEILGTRLEKGPVGLLYSGHFVLVYAIDGDDLMVRDSDAKKPDELQKYKYNTEYIFSSNAHAVELVWLENVIGREQEIAREFSLEYNAENHTFSGQKKKDKVTILHRNGIEGDKLVANGDVVGYRIYVPKHLGGGQGQNDVARPQQQAEVHVEQPQHVVENVAQQQPQQQNNLVTNKVSGDAIFKEEARKEEKQEEAKQEEVKQEEVKQEEKDAEIIRQLEAEREELRRIDEESKEERNARIERNLARHANKISDEDFERTLGTDLVSEYLSTSATLQENEIFRERFEKTVADEVLVNRIKEMYTTITKKTKLSAAKMADRVNISKHRLAQQKELRKNQLWLVEKRKDSRKKIRSELRASDAVELNRLYKSEEEKEAVQNWTVRDRVINKAKQEYIDLAFFSEEAFSVSRYHSQLEVIEEVGQMNISDFDYSSDEEFIAAFPIRYEKLVKASSARVFFDKYCSVEGHNSVPQSSMTMIDAKIEMFSKIRKEYEDNMKLLSSPYYLLMADEDISVYKGKKGADKLKASGLDEGLKEYIRLYLSFSEKRDGKARSNANVYGDILKLKQQQYARRDCNKVNSLLDGIDLKGKTVIKDGSDAVISDIYHQKRNNILNSFPKDDAEFLRNHKQVSRGTIIGDLTVKELDTVEEIVLGIIEKGEINGQKIKNEDKEKVNAAISKFIQLRKQSIISVTAQRTIAPVVSGLGFDVYNPEFIKTSEGKLAVGLLRKDGEIPENIQAQGTTDIAECTHALQDLFYTLKGLGYKLHRKEDISKKDAYDALFTDRAAYTAQYYKDNGLGHFDKITGIPMEYPVFTVNGQKITAYNTESVVMKKLRNKQFTVKSENAEEVIRLLKEFSDLQREFAIINNSKRMLDGVGTFFSRVGKRILLDRVTPASKRIFELLANGELEEVNGTGELQKEAKKELEAISDKVFTDAIGRDYVSSKIRKLPPSIIGSVNKIYRKLVYGKGFSEQELQEGIGQMYAYVFKGKSLNNQQVSQRFETAMENYQHNGVLLQIVEGFHNEYMDTTMILKKQLSADDLRKLGEDFKTPEEKEALQYWVIKGEVQGKEKKISVETKLLSGNDSKQVRNDAYEEVLTEVGNMEISEFQYEDDDDFMDEIARKYPKLVKASSAKVFLDRYKKDNPGSVLKNNMSLAMIEAKIEVLTRLRKEYEDRIDLITSPQFVLMTKEDVMQFSGDKGYEKLFISNVDLPEREFILKYLRLSKYGIGSPKKVSALYKTTLKEKWAEYAKLEADSKKKQVDTKSKTQAAGGVKKTYKEVNYKADKLKATVFEEYNIDTIYKKELSADRRATPERFNEVYGEDQIVNEQLASKQQTEAAFREQFGEGIPKKNSLMTNIQDTYQLFKNEKLGKSELGKRADEAKQKIGLRKHLIREQELFVSRRQEGRHLVETRLEKKRVEEIPKCFKTEEEKQAYREWSITKKTGTKIDLIESGYYVEGAVHQIHACNRVLLPIQTTSMDYFYDEDDGKFASEFAKKYQLLCQFSNAETFLKMAESLAQGGQISEKHKLSVSEISAKIQFCKEMKQQYENRMKMMSSPYYVLLRKSDMEIYLGENADREKEKITDPGLREYIDLFQRTQRSRLAMGGDAKAYYEEILSSKRKEQFAKDSVKTRETLDKIKAGQSAETKYLKNNDPIPDPQPMPGEEVEHDKAADRLRGLYKQQYIYNMQSFPQDDMEFYKQVQPAAAGDLIYGMDLDELKSLEKVIFEDVYQNGMIGGKQIEEGFLSEVKETIREYASARRRYIADSQASDVLVTLSAGMDLDLANPLLTGTADYKELSKYFRNGRIPMDIDHALEISREEYKKCLDRVFAKLIVNDYPVFPKYQDQVANETKAYIETTRKEFPDSFTSFTVNGKEYLIIEGVYSDKFKELEGKEFAIDAEEGKELEELLSEQQSLAEKVTFANNKFDENGQKAFMKYTYVNDIKTKVLDMQNRISAKLLPDNKEAAQEEKTKEEKKR